MSSGPRFDKLSVTNISDCSNPLVSPRFTPCQTEPAEV
jgi:hypothetical protein